MVPSLTATATYLLIRSHVVGPLFGGGARITDLLNNPFVDMSAAERYATAIYTLGLYVKLLFVPYPLTHDYFPYHIPIMHWGRLESVLSLALYIGMIAYAWSATGKRRVGAFCVLYFLATLSVVSNLLFPVGSFMSERFLFMPSLAFCLGVAYLVVEKLGSKSRSSGLAVALVLVLGFGWTTAARVPVWATPLSLARADAETSSNSAKARAFLGRAYQLDPALRDH